MPAVSVIILVYRVERYIERCARSLFGQTLGDVEYIFVDDCSPDASMEILCSVLEDFPARRSQVKVLRNDANMGQAYGRRRGVEAASGQYVIHCDSDDWMEPDMLERMYAEARAHDADAVVCGMMKDDVPVPSRYSVEGCNCRDFILEDMVAANEVQSLCRYMVRKDLYSKGIVFPTSNQGEDRALMVQLVYNSVGVFCLDEKLYHWRTNLASVTRDPSGPAVMRRFEGDCANTRLVEAFLEGKGEGRRFIPQLAALKLNSMFDLRPLLRKGLMVAEWRNAFPELKGKVLCNKYITFTHQIEYLMNRYCPPCIIKAVYRLRSRPASS